ncbi:polyisoprenoid-binding protein [Pelomonas sp. HMWF004]|nr:polyisoprenoid-binding protein [Pelomonas sp. HMWF004]
MKQALLLTALLAAVGAAQAQSATYTIEPTHTQVFFEAKHFGTSTNRGRWIQKEGTITLDKAAKTGKVEVTIDVASVSTGIGPFDGHLKSKDFFAAAEFPTAKFVGDKFSFNGDKVTSVAGELTLRGKTNPVTLTATNFNCYDNPMLKREVCGGDFEATIQRSQWGMTYGLPGIPDSIRLLIQIEAFKQ